MNETKRSEKEKKFMKIEKRKPERARTTFLEHARIFTWIILLLAASVCFIFHAVFSIHWNVYATLFFLFFFCIICSMFIFVPFQFFFSLFFWICKLVNPTLVHWEPLKACKTVSNAIVHRERRKWKRKNHQIHEALHDA